jgi:branched-chain amino acid transport system ATP-binding protein
MNASLLRASRIDAFYGDFQALFGVGLALEAGHSTGIIGANGAGKSTLLRVLAGAQPMAGQSSLELNGLSLRGLPAEKIVRLGIALVPEGRRLFPSLSVEENLLMGAQARRSGPWTLEGVYKLFPILRERRMVAATTLSGGQQQMVAIGRALMTNPVLLLCDEISLGLAPIVVGELYEKLGELKRAGLSIIVVEQDIGRAIEFCDYLFCLQEGRVSLEGKPADLKPAAITQAYFGLEHAA